ncbi:ring finger protein [Grosmannia clavigera kw1407]|uniref:RING-type E3 ubiquitin transferase n=1 Tax=Grosmannia clavigera (strain kw1407 / UAMH 11150) TaxID=655863 RepID=F0XM11_GROCL|nr:ring finger protein [Grosmannia clavigera kw1407]EFX01170.1 ring finger protein [Grosmannia clavigera kw1407]
MRLAWYAGASTALAAGVIVSAFHQRANFYSATVHLFQSNLSLMVLVNLTILLYSSLVYGLQRICYGRLRAVEVEQLYDKAWFAVTETCLAMTIFRDEIGGSFIVLFVALLTGKVWGWIGEGRVEALEQQPPANPRLFHMRLSVSLLLSLGYDLLLLRFAVRTVIQAARADMMVMFLFEFAVLFIASLHMASRYMIVLMDINIIRKQTRDRLQARRQQVREEREEVLRRREAGEAGEPDDGLPLPDEDDIDEMDIEVPGWEAKGQYVLGLDLWTDFVKLCLYATFFFVLLTFYGLPLHIIRDLFMTVRSFIKRLGALMKYRQAMREMNRHPDATEEELSRENTCIICREDMHVWDANDTTAVERTRPKKLPCGHILHLGCLKSWMERQQVCPTCRRPVTVHEETQNRNGDAVLFRLGLNVRGDQGGDGGAADGVNAAAQNQGAAGVAGVVGAAGRLPAPNGQAGAHVNGQLADGQRGAAAVRMFNFGPLRLGIAQGGIQDIQQMAQRLGIPAAVAGAGAGEGAGAGVGAGAAPLPEAPLPGVLPNVLPGGLPGGHPFHGMADPLSPEAILADIQAIEQRVDMVLRLMQNASLEAQNMRHVMTEYIRLRQGQEPTGPTTAAAPATATTPVRLATDATAPPIHAGSPELPAGVQIPTGWSLIPLQRASEMSTAAAETAVPAVPTEQQASGSSNGAETANTDSLSAGPSSQGSQTTSAAWRESAPLRSRVSSASSNASESGSSSSGSDGQVAAAGADMSS